MVPGSLTIRLLCVVVCSVYLRKVKIVKSPRYDVSKLYELHAGAVEEDTGAKVPKTEFVEPAVLESV